jgi:NADH-quinone oxidoreductase subunit N
MILAILPELGMVLLGAVVLVFDGIWKGKSLKNLGWLTAGGLFLLMVLTLVYGRPTGANTLVWGNMLHHDWYSLIFRMIFMLGAAVTALIAMAYDYGQKGEFYVLLLTSTLGMTLLASAADLIMLYLAFETASIPLYVLAGFLKEEKSSVEAGFKYLLFGAMSSALMLFGFSLMYGFSGVTNLAEIAGQVAQGAFEPAALLVSLLLILIGFSFKISAFPFHFWAPDVYQGAATPVSGFLSTASKAAGFSVLLRVMYMVFPSLSQHWQLMLGIISALSMTVGNVIALTQEDIKRLLAYSSIAHAGYILIGVSAASSFGVGSAVFYIGAYLLTNLAAFAAVALAGEEGASFRVSDFDGLSRRSPGLALAMLVSFLSLAGMPPLGGFIAKILVFAAGMESGLLWLVVVGAVNSIIGLYYYLIVLKHVYLYQPQEGAPALVFPRPAMLALAALSIGIVVIGTLFTPWYNWALNAAQNLF